jgi:hypothetical protein
MIVPYEVQEAVYKESFHLFIKRASMFCSLPCRFVKINDYITENKVLGSEVCRPRRLAEARGLSIFFILRK